MNEKISVTNYQNFCLYLQDYYALRKRQEPKFSYTSWARELGVANRVYLRAIVLGERPLSEKLLVHFTQGLNLSKSENEYFISLVNYNQSKTLQQKQVFARNILKLKISKDQFKDIADHYDFLSDETLPLLLTLLSFDDVPHKTKVLAKLLKLDPEKVGSSLQRLIELKLLKQEAVSEGAVHYLPQKRSWKTGDAFRSMHFRDFYEAVFSRAKSAIDAYEVNVRRYRTLFVPLGMDEFEDFLKDFEVFVQEQLAKRNVNQLAGRRLYCLNFNFFPVSESLKSESDL